MRRNISIFCKTITLVVTCIYLTSILTGCGTAKAAPRQEATSVKGVKAVSASITTNVEYSSKLKPVQEIVVSSKISGKVATVNADVGSEVGKGQVLFTLEANDLQAQLNQQQASLNVNKVNLEKVQGSTLDSQILQAVQAQQNAQIAYDNAKESFDKNQKLFDSGAIASQTLDDARQKLDNVTVALKSANESLKLLKEKSGPQSVEAAAAQVNQAESGVNYAAIQVQNSIITSPISGTVSIRNVDVGEISAGSSNPAFTIIDTKTMVAEVSVPDKMVSKIKKGQSISIKVSSLENKTLNGTIDFISPAADSKTQFYTVKVNIENSSGELKSGMFARVTLPAENKDNVVTVPNEAIKIEDGVPYIYIVDKNMVAKKPVQMGLANDKITEITEGIKSGDFVITEGQIFLNNGQKVTIAK